jgi:N-acylneuraminate cytidylyltransferase
MELATDDASERLAWQHAIREYRKIYGESSIDVFVSVPPTAPLRKVEDIDRCIESLLDSDADMVYTVTPATRSPYMNIVEVDQAGYARLAVQSSHKPFRRQDTPVLYDSATIAYAARPDHILVSDYFFDGRVKAVVSPKERAWDIDTELDFKIAEYLVGNS